MPETSAVNLKAYERAIVLGDLGTLSDEEKLAYYQAICESVGLNPLSKPFEFTVIRGKLALFANAGCAAQLRQLHGISVTDLRREFITDAGLLLVMVHVQDKTGRTDVATGVVPFAANAGEVNVQDRANAIMAAETKAKRRATLSLCGLGMLDETEVESIRQQEKEATSALPTPTVAPAINQAPAEDLLKKALAEAKPGQTVTVGPAIPAPPPQPAFSIPALAGVTVPALAAQPLAIAPPIARLTAPPPVSRPIAPPPALPKPITPPAPPALPNPNRQPAVEEPVRETPAELAVVADAVARDKDPKPTTGTVTGTSGANTGVTVPISTATSAPAPVPATPVAAASAINTKGEVPCTQEEFSKFVNGRGAKIVRDKLSVHKNAGELLKTYLLRESGEAKLQKISAATFERLLKALEDATAEDAIKLMKG